MGHYKTDLTNILDCYMNNEKKVNEIAELIIKEFDIGKEYSLIQKLKLIMEGMWYG